MQFLSDDWREGLHAIDRVGGWIGGMKRYKIVQNRTKRYREGGVRPPKLCRRIGIHRGNVPVDPGADENKGNYMPDSFTQFLQDFPPP